MLSLIQGLICLCFASVSAEQVLLAHSVDPKLDDYVLTVQHFWPTLGPFNIGTREAVWGADPLEQFGGFRNLSHNIDGVYHSALGFNATIRWSETQANVAQDNSSCSIAWTEIHNDIDWQFMQHVYGWSALQYSSWVRGSVYNHLSHARRVEIKASGILEYRINDERIFGGDFYRMGRASHIVDLRPGKNNIEVRLIRDVRAMGGIGTPSIEAEMILTYVEPGLRMTDDSAVLPDIYDGHTAGFYVGVTLQNTLAYDIYVYGCQKSDDPGYWYDLPNNEVRRLAAGQARPETLRILRPPVDGVIKACVGYGRADKVEKVPPKYMEFSFQLEERRVGDTYRFTFEHPAGVASYAIVRPPDNSNTFHGPISVHVSLHGAGVEADSELIRHSFDGIQGSPILTIFPTGLSIWSSDDWHTAGIIDVLAAVDGLSHWQSDTNFTEAPIDTERFLVSGHSNGGQGAWYMATHQPDRVLAAAPVSGYTSIENYVSYNMWPATEQDRILQTARFAYRNELFLPNLVSTPILQQHGGADENVPAYHSRLMASARAQLGFDSDYYEVESRPHWWKGVMTTPQLRSFYDQQAGRNFTRSLHLPGEFEIVVADSYDFGSKFGIMVDQLTSHDRLGRLKVKIQQQNRCTVRTTNIHRFHLVPDSSIYEACEDLVIDGDEVPLHKPVRQRATISRHDGLWQICTHGWHSLGSRYGRQRGTMDAILRTHGPLQIVSLSDRCFGLALQIASNMLQYYGLASDILDEFEYVRAASSTGNIITLAIRKLPTQSHLYSFPITFAEEGIKLKQKDGTVRTIEYEPGQGVITLRPLLDERLELLIWGFDQEGLEQAMRLVPTLTGAGQPDFIVLGREARWLGVGGAKALGFFDYDWTISIGSLVY